MTNMPYWSFLDQSVLLFPPEWIRSALVLALITVWMVIGLFTYMNYSNRRTHLSLWTVAWMFYSVYLTASIGLEESPRTPFLLMASRACIGISALFMFWGSFQLSQVKRDQRELTLATVLIIIWSYFSAYRVQDGLWLTLRCSCCWPERGCTRVSCTSARVVGLGAASSLVSGSSCGACI